MVKKIDIPKDTQIIQMPFEEAMPDNYLPYAVEVAKDRALPDVRDGLKPVQRRILYGAYMLKAFPDKPYFKSARIVGDILGKYHPHGDTSVYDAMVILAQNFSTRLPLMDGHGNWGSIDGDSAAAMRYTEARLTKVAMEMLKDIDKGVVEMVGNYSDTELEPKVLPARYPNLLVNGAFGIAVGLSTNIPPHHLGEVIDASLAYMENENITVKELMKHVKGPDLPTGGIIIGKQALEVAYETGEGKATLRAKAEIEKLDTGRLGIVITEFPYRKNKARILQTISEMTADKKHEKALEMVTDIRDESDRNGIRAVIELKKGAAEEIAAKVLKYLYSKTELQCSVVFNMVALSNGKPETLGLKQIIHCYIQHQKEVVKKRTLRELEIAERRFHIVEGFMKAIDIIDEIIKVIRASKSKKDSEDNLVKQFQFSSLQAEAIVELMLYRLTGLEMKAFQKEYSDLEKEIRRLKKIIEQETELIKVVKKELLQIKELFLDQRRTLIIADDEEAKIDQEELIVVEDSMILLSAEGYVKRVPKKAYEKNADSSEEIDYREGDTLKYCIPCSTIEYLTVITDRGIAYQIRGISIPEAKWKERGERIDGLIRSMDLTKEKMIAVFSSSMLQEKQEYLFLSNTGNLKRVSTEEMATGKTKASILKLGKEERLIKILLPEGTSKESNLQVSTRKGFEYSCSLDRLEIKRAVSEDLYRVPVLPGDEILDAVFIEKAENKKFTVSLTKQGVLKMNTRSRQLKGAAVSLDTDSELLIVLNNGKILKIPAAMLQARKEDISIEEIFGPMLEGVIPVQLLSMKQNEKDKELYCITKKGIIKRIPLEVLVEEGYFIESSKLKNRQDILIHAAFCYNKEEKDILLVTRKGMALRVSTKEAALTKETSVNKAAMLLMTTDEVIFSRFIPTRKSKGDENLSLLILLNNGAEDKISVKSIKAGNIGTMGNAILRGDSKTSIKSVDIGEELQISFE